MNKKTCTPVIFRKFKEGDVIAIFPTLPGSSSYYDYNCESYMHVGQHGACSLDIISVTKPAAPEEYQDLLEELISIDYDDLKIYKKLQGWMHDERYNWYQEFYQKARKG